MAIAIEAYCVVAQQERIVELLDSGKIAAPNSRELSDGHLWSCSFMAHADAIAFASKLQALGLNTAQGPDSDVVLVNEFDQSMDPYCEWLKLGQWEKAWIGWFAGTEPKSVTAKEGWDPSVGSGVTFSDGSDIEFVRMEGDIEVHRHKETGKELYIGRTETPVEALYQSASRVIGENMRNPGQAPLTGKPRQQVANAIADLKRVCEHPRATWQSWFFLGKGQHAIAELEDAYRSFETAAGMEPNHMAIAREWCGVCLELQRFEEAVDVGRRAVSIEPDNNELIANLAIAHLFAGQLDLAVRTIQAALKLSPDDPINQNIAEMITETREGRRPHPRSFADLNKPAKRRKKSWMFWK